MPSTAAPTTPDNTPQSAAQQQLLIRSFTVPAKSPNGNTNDSSIARANPPGPDIGSTDGVETLFVHPDARIVKFTSTGAHKQGTLPWETLTEKTMAAGPLEIYRVPGSVSFLHSGALLHAIMPRSNCWCVDGVSKFAMRVHPDTYYRIELPGHTPEDLGKAEEFKVTLAKVLFYERTACPFARSFAIDVPVEEAEVAKPKKRRRRTDGPAKKWKLDKAYSWRPEGWTPDQDKQSDASSTSASDEEDGSESADDLVNVDAGRMSTITVKTPSSSQGLSVRERARGLNMRSVTAPPQISSQSTPSSKLRSPLVANSASRSRQSSESPSRKQPRVPGVSGKLAIVASQEDARQTTRHQSDRNRSVISSPGRTPQEPNDLTVPQEIRSLQAIPTDMPPSPPDSSAGFDFTSQDATDVPLPPLSAHVHKANGISLDHSSLLAIGAVSTENVISSTAEQVPETVKGPAAVGSSISQPDQSGSKPDDEIEADGVVTTVAEPHYEALPSSSNTDTTVGDVFVNDDMNHVSRARHEESAHKSNRNEDLGLEATSSILAEQLPNIDGGIIHPIHDPKPTSSASSSQLPGRDEDLGPASVAADKAGSAELDTEQTVTDNDSISVRQTTKEREFAQIQARIQARRSIGGTGVTTGFLPAAQKSVSTRQSFSSSSVSSSRSSHASRKGDRQHDQAFASALVRRACAVFFGPPASLVAIMLKIARRFAQGVFPSSASRLFSFESPADMPRRVPGSFDLDGSDVEALDDSDLDDYEGYDDEDDFGVPLKNTSLKASVSEAIPRQLGDKQRRGWGLET